MEGQSQVSISKDQLQAALGKVSVGTADLEGLRLYAAAAVIESPGGWLSSAATLDTGGTVILSVQPCSRGGADL